MEPTTLLLCYLIGVVVIVAIGLYFAGILNGEDEASGASGSTDEGATTGDRKEGAARKRRGGMDRMKRGGAALDGDY